MVFCKVWQCQHHHRNKTTVQHTTDCPAKIDIKIKKVKPNTQKMSICAEALPSQLWSNRPQHKSQHRVCRFAKATACQPRNKGHIRSVFRGWFHACTSHSAPRWGTGTARQQPHFSCQQHGESNAKDCLLLAPRMEAIKVWSSSESSTETLLQLYYKSSTERKVGRLCSTR